MTQAKLKQLSKLLLEFEQSEKTENPLGANFIAVLRSWINNWCIEKEV